LDVVPPAPPPPTTNTSAVVIPEGTDQLQLPTVVNVRTVSPFERDVEVGTQLFALAGTGMETKRLVSRIAEIIVAIFGRAATIFVRTKSKITCTSLLE
jgi:hypothetical protein